MAGGVVDVGSLPVLAAGARLGVAWRPSPVVLELSGSYFPRATATLGAGDVGGQMSLLAFEARLCRELGVGALDLAPCASVEIGRLAGQGFGVVNRTPGEALWVAVAPGLLATIPFAGGRVSVRFGADAVFPLNRPTFVLGGVGNVFQPSPVAGRATLGFELRFW